MTGADKRCCAIDGDTKLMGLLGEDMRYTQSPRLHNRAAALLGINAAYLALPLPARDVAPFLKTAWRAGAVGFNVTTPHKELVARLYAKGRVRSVNTLYRGAKGWQAASTDAAGFARALGRMERTLDSFERVVLLGAGGAALAILDHLAALPRGPREIVVLRRAARRDATLQRTAPLRTAPLTAKALARELQGRGEETLVVQATSAPHRGDDLRRLVPALAGFRGVLSDLVYGKPSALYFAAVAQDLATQDGEAMLIEQARLAQELWWGKAAPYEVLAAALRGR